MMAEVQIDLVHGLGDEGSVLFLEHTLQLLEPGEDCLGLLALDPTLGRALHAESRKRGARLMTTEKDFIRLEKAEREGIGQFPVALTWSDDRAFSAFLDHQLEAFR